MKILVVLGHPKKGSFNHAIAETAIKTLRTNQHTIFFHDLYEEEFDPVLPSEEIPQNADLNTIIRVYCDEISKADAFIIIHPNWWGQPPAILKGWVDRVFRPEIAYTLAGGATGLLKAEIAIVLNTSDTPPDRELALFGDPLETLWKKCIFQYCGVKKFFRKTYGVIITSNLTERKKWLNDVEKVVDSHFPPISQS